MTSVREATAGDVHLLVALMTDFYAEADFPLPAVAAARTFDALLADPRLGRIWLVETGPENDVARRVYSRAGFADTGRMLLARPLAAPVHEGEDENRLTSRT